MKYHDISVPIYDGMATWPGDPPVGVSTHKSVEQGDGANVLKMSFSSHIGTHLDAPNHIGLALTVDQIPPDTLIGPARVVESDAADLVRLSDLEGIDLKRWTRILFKTRNSGRTRDRFRPDFVALEPVVARRLQSAGVRLVGIDAMSVDPVDGKGEAHRLLLSGGVILLENINLSKVPAGEYELICLPLRLKGADGSPARAVLREI